MELAKRFRDLLLHRGVKGYVNDIEKYVVKLLYDPDYSLARARLVWMLQDKPDTVASVQEIVHSFTTAEFPGYETPNVIFLKYPDSLIQRKQREILGYLHAAAVAHHYLHSQANNGTRAPTFDLNKYVQSFKGLELKNHLHMSGRSCRTALCNMLLPNSKLIECNDSTDAPRMFNRYGVGLVAEFHVDADFRNTSRSGGNKFHGYPSGHNPSSPEDDVDFSQVQYPDWTIAAAAPMQVQQLSCLFCKLYMRYKCCNIYMFYTYSPRCSRLIYCMFSIIVFVGAAAAKLHCAAEHHLSGSE